MEAFIWNVGTYHEMVRETFKPLTCKNQRINVYDRGGLSCSSVEISVMEMERRG